MWLPNQSGSLFAYPRNCVSLEAKSTTTDVAACHPTAILILFCPPHILTYTKTWDLWLGHPLPLLETTTTSFWRCTNQLLAVYLSVATNIHGKQCFSQPSPKLPLLFSLVPILSTMFAMSGSICKTSTNFTVCCCSTAWILTRQTYLPVSEALTQTKWLTPQPLTFVLIAGNHSQPTTRQICAVYIAAQWHQPRREGVDHVLLKAL